MLWAGMKVPLRLLAWLLAAAVTFATLGPADFRPHSDLGQDGEHVLAFVLVGLLFGLAYPQRRWFVSSVSIVLIALLEIMQLWAPGRHARLEDFIVDALAACVGLAITAAIEWVIARRRDLAQSPSPP